MDGKTVMTLIANNPGNIETGKAYAGQTGRSYSGGKIVEDGRFAEFDSPEMGLRAIFRDLRTKMKRHKGDVNKIISEFAPPTENVTSKYINRIKSAIGGNKLTNRNMKSAIKELVAIESDDNPKTINYYLDNPDIINSAEKLSYIDMPSNVTGKDAIKLSIMDVPIGTQYKDAMKVYHEGEYPRKYGGRVMKDPDKNYNAQRFI